MILFNIYLLLNNTYLYIYLYVLFHFACKWFVKVFVKVFVNTMAGACRSAPPHGGTPKPAWRSSDLSLEVFPRLLPKVFLELFRNIWKYSEILWPHGGTKKQ